MSFLIDTRLGIPPMTAHHPDNKDDSTSSEGLYSS